MQNPALSLSPLTPFLKPPNRNSNAKVPVLTHSLSLVQLGRHSCCGVSWKRTLDTFSSSYSLHSKTQISASFLVPNQQCRNLLARAALVPGSASEDAKQAELAQTLQLGSMFGIWYLLNINFNIFNKQVITLSKHILLSVLTF